MAPGQRFSAGVNDFGITKTNTILIIHWTQIDFKSFLFDTTEDNQ